MELFGRGILDGAGYDGDAMELSCVFSAFPVCVRGALIITVGTPSGVEHWTAWKMAILPAPAYFCGPGASQWIHVHRKHAAAAC